MSLEFPTPRNFKYDEVFYFNTCTAMIWGRYKNAKDMSLGMRWIKAESPLGYPNIFGMGMWMVVPDNLAFLILDGIEQHYASEKVYIRNESIFKSALNNLRYKYLNGWFNKLLRVY